MKSGDFLDDFENSERERAIKILSSSLARRMHTCRELSDKLKKKGFSDSVIDDVIDEFIKNDIINDRNFADVYIIDAALINYKGEFRIRQELVKKGVARSVIDAAFAESEVDFENALFEYLKIKLRGEEIGDYAAHEKLKHHLAGRGYSLGEIKRGITRYETERE